MVRFYVKPELNNAEIKYLVDTYGVDKFHPIRNFNQDLIKYTGPGWKAIIIGKDYPGARVYILEIADPETALDLTLRFNLQLYKNDN